jgi:formate hydrogenlyase subunit 3/multisubunit Na+/H+ antiporter MnhD subunit
MKWIAAAMPHLVVAPILLPLIAAALMLALGDQRRGARALVNVLASAAGLAIAVALFAWVDAGGPGRRSASTCRRTGRCPTASCWSPTASPR